MGPAKKISSSLLFLLVGACGSNAVPQFPDGGGNGTISLISTDWSFAAPGEKYLCDRVTTTKDVYVTEFDPISPPGTHHDVLAMGDTGKSDGLTTCDGFQSIFVESTALFGSGIGTDPLILPAGVAMHIPAGQQLLLNLHLFDATDGALSGTSGIDVKTTDLASVQHEATTILVGPLGFDVPTGQSDVSASCTAPTPVTVFAVMPHMHKLGVHMKVTATRAAGDLTLLDQDYSFDSQKNYPVAPSVDLAAGDKVNVTCSYVNAGAPETFGESTNEEMCFAVVYHYPPLNAGVVCSN